MHAGCHPRRLAALAAALLAAPAVHAQLEDARIEVVDVAPRIHMLVGPGGNVGVSSGDDGVFVIDDKFAPLGEKLLAAIRSFSDGPVRFVVDTHWHGDHTGGNEKLGRAGAVIVAHENVRARMGSEQVSEFFGRTTPPSPPGALPVVTFSRDVSFHLNGDEVRVLHVPKAHTDGDAIVYFRGANVIHTGDVFFSGRYPIVDLESGGSIDGMIAAADRVLSLADDRTRIIPGHGPLSTRADLEAYVGLLRTARERVAAGIAAGQDADALVAARPLAEYDATWGAGFMTPDRFLRLLYADLSRR